MKKIYLLFLIISIAFISQGQTTTKVVNGDTINVTDSKNLKQGYWEESLNNVVSKGSYLDDKKNGVWTTYGAKGSVNSIINYKNGKKHGVSISLDDYGYLKSESFYKNDQLHGIYRAYASGGRLISESNYTNGALNGQKKTYYETNAKLQEESTYVNGLKEGKSLWYDTDGKLIAQYSYKNGKFEGVNYTFYTSGNLQTEETYSKDIQTGHYKEYFDDAKSTLKLSGNYVDGKKDGKWIEYDNKGSIIKTTVYKNGIEK
jgi:antitoxin component YwqK of YwqJK toxin-antitoxin module